MEPAGTTAGRRRGRYALLAAIVLLTVLGVTALTRGASDRPQPSAPAAASAAAPHPPTSAAPTARQGGRVDELTTGPLMRTAAPTRVSIPELRVTAALVGLGQQADGSMQVPDDATTVGWYTKAPTPGSLGPAVLAGHVDLKKRPGTFARLADLRAGDAVTVERADDTMAMFVVTKVERYAKDRFPSAAVYGAIDHAGLRLITCGGRFDDTSGHYEDNIVVYAALRTSHPI